MQRAVTTTMESPPRIARDVITIAARRGGPRGPAPLLTGSRLRMPDKISQRQQPVATLATLVEALRVHQVLLEDHLSNTGKHNKIEIAGLTDGEVMAFKGLARHLGFVNALPAGMDGSIPDLIRAILKGFLLPLSDADGALLEERGQWAAREQQLLASIAQLQADLAFRQGVLNTSIKDYLELQDEIKTLQEEDAREPRAALKRKLEEVTAECAQLDAEVDRKKEKLKEMEKWPVFELQRELDRSRRCLTMNADGELADVVHRRNKKTLVTRRDALLGARDSLMSFSIGMAKKSLPMLRIMRTRIATLQHKRPPAPVAWPDQEILKKHIGTGETRLSSQGVLLSLPARDKRRFDERAIAKHSRDVRDARLWVKLRDTIPGGCSVRVTAGAKKILGPVVPCEQLIQQARKDQTERVDSIVPLYRTNIAEDVTAMPDFETGVYGWQNHPTNSAQLMVMRLFLENPDSPVWRDMKVTKRAKLDIGCGGDGHRTRLGAGTMNMLAMSIRPVDPAFPDLWQRPDWVSVNLESPGGDKRANLLKNAAAWLEVIKYLAGHEIPVVLDGVEIMIKFRVFILGDMAWQWAMRGCGGMSDPDKHFCHLCDAHEDDRFVLFQMAHPLPGETLPEFARRHFMGVREAREINKWFAGQPRTGPAWESELELRKYTTDTTVGPTINLALYPDDETSTDAQPSDGGARASQRRSARTSGKALPSSALLRVHRTMPMDRKSDHDLIPGIPAWQYGFDWEHCVTRIVEALLKIIQTEMIGGTAAESTSRIERFNRRMKEIKCSWKVELCAPNQVGDKATPKYKAVQLSGSEARKLLNEHLHWLDVLDTERGELYREVWGLFKSINEVGRSKCPSEAERAQFMDDTRRFHRLVVMRFPRANCGSYYLHCVGLHAAELLEKLGAVWRTAQSGVENRHTISNRIVRQSTGWGGASGTTAGQVVQVGTAGTCGRIHAKGERVHVPNEPLLQVMQRGQRMYLYYDGMEELLDDPQVQAVLRKGATMGYDFAAKGHQSVPQYAEAVLRAKLAGVPKEYDDYDLSDDAHGTAEHDEDEAQRATVPEHGTIGEDGC
eukprot:jgi/Mesvir1/5516/Mv15557-RA.1